MYFYKDTRARLYSMRTCGKTAEAEGLLGKLVELKFLGFVTRLAWNTKHLIYKERRDYDVASKY